MSKRTKKTILIAMALSFSTFPILGIGAMEKEKTTIDSTNIDKNFKNNQKENIKLEDILNKIGLEKRRLNKLIYEKNNNATYLNNIINNFMKIYKIIEQKISKNNFFKINILNESNLNNIESIKKNLENSNKETTPHNKGSNTINNSNYNQKFDNLFYKIYDEISEFKKVYIEKGIKLNYDKHYEKFKNTILETIENFNKNIKNINNHLKEKYLNKIFYSTIESISKSKNSINSILSILEEQLKNNNKWFHSNILSLENETKKILNYTKELFEKMEEKITNNKFNIENIFNQKYYNKLNSLTGVIFDIFDNKDNYRYEDRDEYKDFIYEIDDDFYKTDEKNKDSLNFKQTIKNIDLSLSNVSKLLNDDTFDGILGEKNTKSYSIKDRENYKKEIYEHYFTNIKTVFKELLRIYRQYKLINEKFENSKNTSLNSKNDKKTDDYITSLNEKIKNYTIALCEFSNKQLDENDIDMLKNLKQEILELLDINKVIDIDNLKNNKENFKKRLYIIKTNLDNIEKKFFDYDELEKNLTKNIENELFNKIKNKNDKEYKTCSDDTTKKLENKKINENQFEELKKHLKNSFEHTFFDIKSNINQLKNEDIKNNIKNLKEIINPIKNEKENEEIFSNLKNIIDIIEKIIEKDLLIEKDTAEFSNIIQNNKETLKIISLNEEYFKKFKTFCNNIKIFNIFEMISTKKNIENEQNPNLFISNIAKLNNIFYDISNSILKLGKDTENYLKYKNILYSIHEKLNYIIHYFNVIQKLNTLITNYKDYYIDELKIVSEKEKINLKKVEELKRTSKEINKSKNLEEIKNIKESKGIENIKKIEKNQKTGNESLIKDSKKPDEIQEEFENSEPTNSINEKIETLTKNFEVNLIEKQKIIYKSFIENSKKINDIKKEIKNIKQTNSMSSATKLSDKKFDQINDIENSAKSNLKEINNILEMLDKLKVKKEPQKNIISKERNNKISEIKFLTNVVASELIDHPEYHILESLNDEDLNLLNSLLEKTEIEDEKK